MRMTRRADMAGGMTGIGNMAVGMMAMGRMMVAVRSRMALA